MSKYVGFRLGKVHESHVISEYYCGRCGYPVTDHDSFCPECGGAFRECDASNLEAENAKLRKLVDALMGCGTRYHTMSGACPMFDANAKDCCKAEEIARELGVEVSNA